MRTTKRFTPLVIERFIKQGRGEGSHQDYRPWHRVSRGDPASSGRSHLLHWKGRLRELLSDGELGQQLFATMLANLDDCLEQYRLTPGRSQHPLVAYGRLGDETFPGTEELSKQLGIKHPQLSVGKDTTLWQQTTDLVLVFRPANGQRRMLAIAFKPSESALRKRQRQLLRLEREYWHRRGVDWLLITPGEYDESVYRTLQRSACWALADEVTAGAKQAAAQIARLNSWAPLSTVLEGVATAVGTLETAQRALWQAVWAGDLPLDLRRGWRPHLPLKLVTAEQFESFNPLASRRSAWI